MSPANATVWKKVRAKYTFDEIDDRLGTGRNLPLLAVSIHHGVVLREEITDRPQRANEVTNYKVCAVGDLVVNRMRAFQGALGVSPVKGIVSTDYAVLRPREGYSAEYFHYLLRSRWFVGEMIARLRGIGRPEQGNVRTPRVNVEDLGDIAVAVPDLATQNLIAAFLRRETARVNSLVERKLKLITLLNERRTEVCRSAFGEWSGKKRVEWLPPVPDEWPFLPLRWVSSCLDGRRVPLNGEERARIGGYYPYWGANGVVDHIGDYLFDEPLVLLGEDGAPFFDYGKDVAFVVEGKIWVNNHIHVLRPTSVTPGYLAHVLNLVDYAPFISGSTRDKLTQSDMGRILIPVPPLAVQQQITEAITSRTAGLEELCGRIKRQVALLEEHRQALVTATVLGELDLRAV